MKKLIFFPLLLTIRLLAFLLSHAALLLGLAGSLLAVLAVAVLLTGAIANGLILMGMAYLISPLGLPMLAAKLLGRLARMIQ